MLSIPKVIALVLLVIDAASCYPTSTHACSDRGFSLDTASSNARDPTNTTASNPEILPLPDTNPPLLLSIGTHTGRAMPKPIALSIMDSTIQKLEAKKPFEINDPVPACGFEVRAAPPDQQNFLFVDHLRYNPSFTFSVALQAVMGYRDWQEERLYAVFSYVRIFSPDRRVSYGTLQLGRDHELFDDVN